MNRVAVLPEEIQLILDKLGTIESMVQGGAVRAGEEDQFIDSQEFLEMMHISKRCAQNWRDTGKIPFSQIGSKIYYRRSDIRKMLEKYYIDPTK